MTADCARGEDREKVGECTRLVERSLLELVSSF